MDANDEKEKNKEEKEAAKNEKEKEAANDEKEKNKEEKEAANDEKEKIKEEKEAAMDNVQPGDSVSNVSPNWFSLWPYLWFNCVS